MEIPQNISWRTNQPFGIIFTIGVQVSFMVIPEYLRDGGAGGWGKGGFQGHILFCVSVSINISKIYD